MRIGIDNISPGESTSGKGPGGMRMYLQALLIWFAKLAPKNEYILFTPAYAEPLLDKNPDNVQVVKLSRVPVSKPLRILYQQSVLPLVLDRHHLDVFFATATVAPLMASMPVVLAVQFIQFYQSPEAYGRFRTAYLETMLPLSLRKAKKVIIFTEASKQDLINWTGISAEKVNVVPHGLADDFLRLVALPTSMEASEIRNKLTNGQPYVLYVSATYGYKNHARLIRAFSLLKQKLKTSHVLLLVGSQVSVSYRELKKVASEQGITDVVIFAGPLEHKQVIGVCLGADLAVIPTLYETFGFPALEAMACGCPVVTSNIGSMAELAGDAAILIDPYDEKSIAEGMEQVLSNGILRQTLIKRGLKRVSSYTWERSVTQTLGLLEKAGRG